MRFLAAFFTLFYSVAAFAMHTNNRYGVYNEKSNENICVQAYLNAEPLNYNSFLSKKSKGILTVTKNNSSKIYFNVTLKSNIGKKDEPPIYLRFIKQKALDIKELLEYAEEGDEIYIEEFVSSLNKINLSCMPASFMVSDNL